jgi:hypothetical protein
MRDFLFNLIEDPSGNANATWISQAFNPGSYVYTVAVDPIILVKDIPQIDSYAKFHATIVWQFAIFCFQCALNFNGTIYGIQGSAELSEDVITGCINDTSVMRFNQFGNDFPICSNGVDRVFVIVAHQLAVAFDIRTEDGPEFALYAVVSHDGPRRDIALSQ